MGRVFEVLAAVPVTHNPKRAEQCTRYAHAIRILIQRMEDNVKKEAALKKKETF